MKIDNRNLIIIFHLFILFGLNIISHYVPFERVIISPDSFSLISDQKHGLSNFLVNPSRPLQYFLHEMEYYILGYNFNLHFAYLLFSVFLLTTIIYFFFILFFNSKISFWLSFIYILLPYKIETYHSSILAVVNIHDSIFILCLLLFIIAIRKNSRGLYLITILVYLIGILSRESGFFIPIIFAIFLYLIDGKRNLSYYYKTLTPFVLIMCLYLIYRFTGAFFYTSDTGREVLLSNIPYGFNDLFHVFVGRYLIKNIIYGFYQFISFSHITILILLIINFIIIYFINKNYYVFKLNKINKKETVFFVLFALILVVPYVINGSLGGRSTILSSLGVSVLIFYFISYFHNKLKYITIFIIFCFLIISQGNGLAQVISLRIPNSIYEYVLENKEEIGKFDYVIVDAKSFADNIEYSLLDKDFLKKFKKEYNKYNVLNTYMGSQSFESWGFYSMIKYITKNQDIKVYTTTEDIKFEQGFVKSVIYVNTGYNNRFRIDKISLKKEDTYIIDYPMVYSNGYYSGNRFKK